MSQFEIENLVRMLQASVAPCLLISGFGFLLLTMTNRLARATDRVRSLHGTLKQTAKDDAPKIGRQIVLIFKRCRILQAAIVALTFSIFFVGLNVFFLFSSLRFEVNLRSWIEVCFGSSIIMLILSLTLFLIDISLTLQSLKIEIGKDVGLE